MKHYTVTAAILLHNNQILCMQRGPSKYDYIAYKFEFPGGKVELGESLEGCLSRELIEEMDLHINVNQADFFMSVDHVYPDFSITLHSFICSVPSRTFTMKEHISYQWLSASDLMTLEWAPADGPIVDKLMEVYGDEVKC